MNEQEQLEQAIVLQESLRGAVPDSVIDMAIVAIQEKLATLNTTPTSKPKKQRKQVTVLFADVSGFTAMSETMDAEDISDTMNALWQQIDRAIIEHGGFIDKHIGDAVMALWGVEEANEDDPEQAINAALAMQTAVRGFPTKQNISLKMRIGINTGPVLLDQVGTTGEFTVMGDTVNIAYRLEQAAPIGQILVSHNTYRHVRGVFDVEVQDPLTVKGKSDPLQVYLAKQAKPRAFRMGPRGIEGIATKTIGRDHELEKLNQAYETAAQQNKTTVVTIVGDAGVGKSRLLYEFNKQNELRPEIIRYFKGRASPQTQGIPNYLLRDMLATRFQIKDSDLLPLVRQKLVTGIGEFLASASEMKAHILGAWLGYDFSDSPHLHLIQKDHEQIRNRAILYLGQFFAAVGAKSSILISLEDIHWADRGSLNTMIELVQRYPQLPLLIVCVTRPSLYSYYPQWGNPLPNHARLDLAPLSENDTHKLVAEILRMIDPLPQVLLDLVSNRAEGNPFYAEEIIKMLIDDGVIVTNQENWVVSAKQLLELKVPSTLVGVLQARLDRLSPAEKIIAQQASVIGRIFWDQALLKLQNNNPVDLSTLQSKEIIFPRTNTAFAGTKEYIFKNAILRDVTYETVLKQTRRKYHLQVADWLVATAEANGRSDEYAALIGKHYQLANKLETAASWYKRAGQQAIIIFAHKEAIYYLSLALQFTSNEDDSIYFSLLMAREKTYDNLGNRSAQHKDLTELETLAKRLTIIDQARIAFRQAKYALVTSEFAHVRRHAKATIKLGQQAENKSMMASGYWAWGMAHVRRGQYTDAKVILQKGLTLAQECNDARQMAYCLNALGITTNDQRNFTQAKSYFTQFLAISRTVGDRQAEGGALNNLGMVADHQGDYATAQKCYEQFLSIHREIGHRFGEALSLCNLGAVFSKQGDYATSKTYLKQSLLICREIDSSALEGGNLLELGVVAFEQGDLQTAESNCKQAQLIHKKLNQLHFLVEDWACLAQVKLAQGDSESAQLFAEQVVNYLKENTRLDGSENPMRAFHATWDALVALGKAEEADHVLTLAIKIIEDYLNRNEDVTLQEMYLRQPHHQVLWAEYEKKRETAVSDA